MTKIRSRSLTSEYLVTFTNAASSRYKALPCQDKNAVTPAAGEVKGLQLCTKSITACPGNLRLGSRLVAAGKTTIPVDPSGSWIPFAAAVHRRAEINSCCKELMKSPVLLISQSASSSSLQDQIESVHSNRNFKHSNVYLVKVPKASCLRKPEAKESLQRACVRYDELELDRLAAEVSTAVAEQLEAYNRSGPSGTNMTWTIRKGARWLPPKNIGGRRWYQDDAGLERFPDKENDPFVNGFSLTGMAKYEVPLGEKHWVPTCGGSALRTRISNPGQKLLRQDAKLDEPDKYGAKKSFPSWGRTDLLLRNVDGVTDYLRSRDVDRVRDELAAAARYLLRSIRVVVVDVTENPELVGESIFSMFEITLANWPPVSRLLAENVSEWFMLFGVLHKLAIGFAVVSFKQMTEHKEVSAWLSSMELDVSDPKKLFNLIDNVKRDGTVSLEELIYGVGRLKGPAKSLDMETWIQ
eukprot:Skav214381  [mRNA]  locus=scaffold4284:94835:110044:- [translate_table: standard]